MHITCRLLAAFRLFNSWSILIVVYLFALTATWLLISIHFISHCMQVVAATWFSLSWAAFSKTCISGNNTEIAYSVSNGLLQMHNSFFLVASLFSIKILDKWLNYSFRSCSLSEFDYHLYLISYQDNFCRYYNHTLT